MELRLSDVKEEDRAEVFETFAIGKEKLRSAEISHILRFLNFPGWEFPPSRMRNSPIDVENESQASSSDDSEVERYLTGRACQILMHPGRYQWCVDNPLCEHNEDVIGILCRRFRQTMEESIQDGREKVWDLLPSFFGFHDWTTLQMHAQAREQVRPRDEGCKTQ